MEFSLTFDVSIQRNFPMEQNSLNPVNLAVEVSPPLLPAQSSERYTHILSFTNNIVVTHHLTALSPD